MEPAIELDSSVQILYFDYKKLLSDKIKSVCSKVGFSYNGIKWIIYKPKTSNIYCNNPEQFQKLLIDLKVNDYGFCVPQKRTIYISTLALENEYSVNSLLNGKLKQLSRLGFPAHNGKDLLANIILDEITHIATGGRNHGDAVYEEKFKELRNAYYCNTTVL